MNGKAFVANYSKVKSEPGPLWQEIQGVTGETYNWPTSTYIAEPPFFDGFTLEPPPSGRMAAPLVIRDARVMALFGDSITTDHISPAGSIKDTSPAGKYLQAKGVLKPDFNSYGARRGNHEVMVRGTFANIRLKNLMVPGVEGGMTRHLPDGEQMFIYDASVKYQAENVGLVVIAGKEYGSGSSRDWAAKGTLLLGVKAVIAESFERIHRSNLVQMGVLPLQFLEGQNRESLHLTGEETFDFLGIPSAFAAGTNVQVVARRPDGKHVDFEVKARVDTPQEAEYYRNGGILPYVLRQLIANEVPA
jgi:aconitate hydratase A / 2-methylisocitrate dehydratase